jgi:O-antigen ligase
MKWPIRVLILPGYLLLCLLLGGSSAANWANVALQLLALPLIFRALAARKLPEISPAGRKLVAMLCALVALIALQLMPLPPGLWTELPGRESVARSYELMGQPLPWLTLSLAPHETLMSAMWLLPPAAVLLTLVSIGTDRPDLMVWVLLGVTMAAMLLGTLQMGGGTTWYFYEFTNFGGLTGFFANTNHMATLLLVTVPFLAAIYARKLTPPDTRQKSLALAVLAALASAFVISGVIMIKSLAGIALLLPVGGASLIMILQGRRRAPLYAWLLIAAVGAGSTALVLTPSSGNDLTQAGSATYQLTRYHAWPRTLAAALDFAPMGSGVGTFVNVYPRYEDPTQVEMTYMNHAHNEYIEIALETGVPGLLLLAMFIHWWMRRTFSVWRDPQHGDVFAQAATIASAAILVHSIVDYPLRTTAISSVFALCCGLMAIERGQMQKRIVGTAIGDQ